MPSIFDIAPPEIATRTVNIWRGDQQISIVLRGLEIREITRLMARFPNLRERGQDIAKKIAERRANGNGGDHGELADAAEIAGQLPAGQVADVVDDTEDMLPAVISLGAVDLDFGEISDTAKREQLIAERFSRDEREILATVIMNLTNPEGSGRRPTISGGEAVASSKGPDTSSSSQSTN